MINESVISIIKLQYVMFKCVYVRGMKLASQAELQPEPLSKRNMRSRRHLRRRENDLNNLKQNSFVCLVSQPTCATCQYYVACVSQRRN